MKKLRTASSVAAAGVAAALVAGSAVAATHVKPIAFVGTYSGNASVQIADQVATITANGTGVGAKIGAGKITGAGKGDASQQPCVPFTGPGTITGAKGTITFSVLTGSSGCGDADGQIFSISGKAKVLKATGALAKTKGTLKLTGTWDHGSGAFKVTFKGALTK